MKQVLENLKIQCKSYIELFGTTNWPLILHINFVQHNITKHIDIDQDLSGQFK